MTEDLQEQVRAELDRIGELSLSEQPEAYAQLRDVLEAALDAVPQGE
jgi:hypothetical protein